MYGFMLDKEENFDTANSDNREQRIKNALFWLRNNNRLYKSFYSNYDTLYRFDPDKIIQLHKGSDFEDISKNCEWYLFCVCWNLFYSLVSSAHLQSCVSQVHGGWLDSLEDSLVGSYEEVAMMVAGKDVLFDFYCLSDEVWKVPFSTYDICWFSFF